MIIKCKRAICRHNYQLMRYYTRKAALHQADGNLNNWLSRGPDAPDPREIIEPIN